MWAVGSEAFITQHCFLYFQCQEDKLVMAMQSIDLEFKLRVYPKFLTE